MYGNCGVCGERFGFGYQSCEHIKLEEEKLSTIKELQMKIDECQAKIKRIQDDCSHPEDCVTKINKGDTGNWCPQDDKYWKECQCDLCDKRWTEDQ